MTEEEKRAIKHFYNLRATIEESYMLFDEEINVKCGKETIKQISIILNLTEKQDNKIKELEKELKERKSYNKSTKEALRVSEELEKFYNEEASRLKTELEEKDNIIFKMAKVINNFDIDEDICKQMGQKKYCSEYDEESKCEKCIIEYFEKKAEGK